MAETIDLETKREAERRLALLALASEQAEPAASCLDAEHLACLVEGRLNPEQVEICHAHLACCEHCYATWRQLDQEWQQQAMSTRRGKIVQLVKRPGFLTATGSLLAIAASITVFLNLTTEVNRQGLVRRPEKPVQEQSLTASVAEPPATQDESGKGAPAPAASPTAINQQHAEEQTVTPAARPVESTKKQALSRTDRAQPREQKIAAPAKAPIIAADRAAKAQQAPAPAVSTTPPIQSEHLSTDNLLETKEKTAKRAIEDSAPVPVQPQQTVSMAGAMADKTDGSGALTIADWHQNIRIGCQGQPDPDFVVNLTEQGKRLLTGKVMPPLSTENQQQIKQILNLLAEQPQTADQRCQALLELLNAAERGGNR